ncbi:DEAD-box ATP-dependent RNA helicase 30 [Culex quinquefasciatus]|uniref:DEAD-box ATP-dependent RNA helicase 30 n=1 Tax=Culex quinquefasciatus TaxID=7176 RepID=UPI0018E2DE1B|nr:DEAD-box ATP-dependent RNA helicase 30 [Culex quinquefasciatus]XP_038104473.1 DEAD-box ATP-dependent RNA helicase 30 [Culex quinquefasciatus]
MTHQLRLGRATLLLFITISLADATVPTIDNIVKVLQSPAFQQIILPQPLADASMPAADTPATSDDKTKKPQMDSPATSKDTPDDPTLKLVTRVLDTLRPAPIPVPLSVAAPAPAAVLLLPQRRALPGCPLCDASVYSYCDFKVFHDGCCCGTANGGGYGHGGGGGGFGGGFGGNGLGGYGGCGYQEDCSFLYANSCYEHQLIVNCCCNSPY